MVNEQLQLFLQFQESLPPHTDQLFALRLHPLLWKRFPLLRASIPSDADLPPLRARRLSALLQLQAKLKHSANADLTQDGRGTVFQAQS